MNDWPLLFCGWLFGSLMQLAYMVPVGMALAEVFRRAKGVRR